MMMLVSFRYLEKVPKNAAVVHALENAHAGVSVDDYKTTMEPKVLVCGQKAANHHVHQKQTMVNVSNHIFC